MPQVTTDDGCTLYCELSGDAGKPAVLLSNSLGTALGMWDAQMPALLGHFRVLRYDSRGHGRSAVPPGPYDIERLGRDALAVADHAGAERFRFCGLSKGGMVGQWLGIHAGDRVERLVLCNTSAHMGSPETWNQRIAAVREGGMAAVVDGVIDRWFTKPFQQREPASVARIRAMLLATDPEGYAASGAAVRDMDQRAGLSRIEAPTLVVAGSHDVPTPPEHAKAIASAIPGATMIELDAAHLSNIEAAPTFTPAVVNFLAG